MKNEKQQIATLAGGCFWCLEAVYEQVCGVERVVSGYIGGHTEHPDYESVCGGRTGHAEAVQITFNVAQISYGELLAIFFSIHDPTTLNRQGNDVGTQYRSAIFYHNEKQQKSAEAMMEELSEKHIWPVPIVTEVTAAQIFHRAEEYHQHYFTRHTQQGYCQFIIAPKLVKLQKYFAKLAR